MLNSLSNTNNFAGMDKQRLEKGRKCQRLLEKKVSTCLYALALGHMISAEELSQSKLIFYWSWDLFIYVSKTIHTALC